MPPISRVFSQADQIETVIHLQMRKFLQQCQMLNTVRKPCCWKNGLQQVALQRIGNCLRFLPKQEALGVDQPCVSWSCHLWKSSLLQQFLKVLQMTPFPLSESQRCHRLPGVYPIIGQGPATLGITTFAMCTKSWRFCVNFKSWQHPMLVHGSRNFHLPTEVVDTPLWLVSEISSQERSPLATKISILELPAVMSAMCAIPEPLTRKRAGVRSWRTKILSSFPENG